MYLIEKHRIDTNHEFYKEIDELCWKSKKLYNRANFIIRQVFIHTSELKEKGMVDHAIYLNYHDIRKMLIKDENYKALPRKISNQVLIGLDKNWKSFFVSIKDWKIHPQKYTGIPSLPKYKNTKIGRNGLNYELGSISTTGLKKGVIKLSKTNISIPYLHTDCKLVCVEISVQTGCYQIETIYKKEIEEPKKDNKKYMGADPGVNNLLTLTSNVKEFTPKIINGRPVKSVNQYYNKKMAEYQSQLPKGVYTSNKIQKLTMKRNNKIDDYFTKAANLVVDQLEENDINIIILGKNDFWKQNKEMGSKNNQNSQSIPFTKLFDKISYKLEIKGRLALTNEESYTSKASFLDLDPIPTFNKNDNSHHQFGGYRESRSWYKILGKPTKIHADVNGSYNIIRKVVPNAFKAEEIEEFAVIPVVNKIRHKDGKLSFI